MPHPDETLGLLTLPSPLQHHEQSCMIAPHGTGVVLLRMHHIDHHHLTAPLDLCQHAGQSSNRVLTVSARTSARAAYTITLYRAASCRQRQVPPYRSAAALLLHAVLPATPETALNAGEWRQHKHPPKRVVRRGVL